MIHQQPGNLRKVGDDVLGNAVGEIFLLGVAGHVGERQHGNNRKHRLWLCRRSRGRHSQRDAATPFMVGMPSRRRDEPVSGHKLVTYHYWLLTFSRALCRSFLSATATAFGPSISRQDDLPALLTCRSPGTIRKPRSGSEIGPAINFQSRSTRTRPNNLQCTCNMHASWQHHRDASSIKLESKWSRKWGLRDGQPGSAGSARNRPSHAHAMPSLLR